MTRRQPGGGSWASRLGASLRSWFTGIEDSPADESTMARFRLLYDRFREILAANDNTLELIADLEESLAGTRPFSVEAFGERVRAAALNAFVMVKNLNLIDGGRHTDLYESLKRINAAIESELPPLEDTIDGPVLLAFEEVQAEHEALVGPKMFNLARIRNELGLPVPDGFVVTAAAYSRLMSSAELWGRVNRLTDVLAAQGAPALGHACREVEDAIRSAPVPGPVHSAMLEAFSRLPDPEPLAAVRSSTLGEDKAASHAGQYVSILNVTRSQLIDAYKQVVASVCSPSAVAYRFEHGVLASETWMAVGVMAMVRPRCSGIMFSRDFHDMAADRIVIAATPGLAAEVASGTQDAYEIVYEPGGAAPVLPAWLDDTTLATLVQYARKLETLFGGPQDIEWAWSRDGVLYVIQSRPMKLAVQPAAPEFKAPEGATPLIAGGSVACRGVIAGPVHIVRDEESIDRLPPGAVLVARHSSPTLSRVMPRCAAIVTEVGSPAGHMAILAREAGVPTIVGLHGALTALAQGMDVTVDAYEGAVYAGLLDAPLWEPRSKLQLPESPATQTLRRVAALVTPLYLVDPGSPEFQAKACRTLHDILRYVHEKAFATMFHFGARAEADRRNAVQLEARLPFEVLLYDLGGGVQPEAAEALAIRPEMIRSVPLTAFLEGMLDPRLRWDRPRPVSARGFMSVLGESMIGPPPDAQQLGRVSYVVCSDRYMNFSTKAGYHFSTVDTWCGESINKNYIQFRFSGGGAAADRRERRIACLEQVLSNLDFDAQRRGDMLVARMGKYERDTLLQRLTVLGQLTICARQLDMLMDSDGSPDFFAKAFLAGELEKFF